MALTTIEYVLRGLNVWGRVDTVQQERYDQLRQGAEAAIKNYVKWPIEQATVTQFYDGPGQQDLALRYPWVSAVANVWLDPRGAYGQFSGGFPTETLLTAGTQYALKLDWTEGAVAFSKEGNLVCLATPNVFWFPSDFFFGALSQRRGLSYALPAAWPKGPGILKVELTYGFATIPLDIQTAVVESVAIFNNTNQYGGVITSESLARYSYSLSTDHLFGSVRQILSRWRDLAL